MGPPGGHGGVRGRMQFRGELKTPAGESRGVPVCLLVDEYHWEIKRGDELLGRWFLADVEVDRVGGSIFKLYLGEDEAEFVAQDALQFAYEGVTAMQEAWLRLKKGNRHRRAAAQKAGKATQKPGKKHQERELPAPVSYANAKRRAPAPARLAPTKEVAVPTPQSAAAAIPTVFAKVERLAKAPKPPKPSRPAPAPVVAAPEPEAKVNHRDGELQRDLELESVGAGVPAQAATFAAAGHHPAESNKGLMSIFRKEQKPPHGHVHRFAEGRTAGGIMRRVCLECAYVSISVGEE